MTQSTLFGRSDATISPCGLYRYTLTREWDAALPIASVGMLNPSTANHIDNDPTITRVINFCRGFGFGGFVVWNLFAYRTPYPKALKQAHRSGVDIVGPWNDAEILKACFARTVIFAWGAGGDFIGRDERVAKMLIEHAVKPQCLGYTKHGLPRHPLMLAGSTVLEAYA